MVFTCQKCFKQLATQQSLNYHQKTSKCGQNQEKITNLSYTLGMCIVGEIILSNNCRIINIKKHTFDMSVGDDIIQHLHNSSKIQFLKNMLEVNDTGIIKDTFIVHDTVHKYILVKEEIYKLYIIQYDFDYFIYVNSDLIVELSNIENLKNKHLKEIFNIDCLCKIICDKKCTVVINGDGYDCDIDRKSDGYYITCKNHVDN